MFIRETSPKIALGAFWFGFVTSIVTGLCYNDDMDKPKVRSRRNASTSNFADGMKKVWQKIWGFLKQLIVWVGKFFKLVGRGVRDLWHSFLRSFAVWSDPKLEPYRDKKQKKAVEDLRKQVIVEETTYAPVVAVAPETREDLFALLREAPMTVLNGNERKAMAAILDLPVIRVSEIMLPEKKMVFVDQDEEMGPLVLDKLYRSGSTYFPVINGQRHIIGTLHTELLNSLDVKDTKPAKDVMEPRVYYVRSDYTLEQALKAFLRTNSQLVLVVDHYEKLVGMLTFERMMSFLFDEKFQDEFNRDNDRLAVAKRRV